MKVLLVDDEADIRRIAELSLKNLGGFEVLSAASGVEGLSMAEEHLPDVVLMDVTMPGLDGLDVLAELRRREATAAMPVVFLTGRTQGRDRERYAAAGAIGVIEKPFDPMTLSAELNRILGR
ncbi:MAG: response regulator [Myxococcales bacterium]|nr:response regulator [Myxococcales bacterium]